MVVTPLSDLTRKSVKYLRGSSSKALKKNEEGPVQGKKSERVRENCEVEEATVIPESTNKGENRKRRRD